LIEGGARVAGSALAAGIVDKVMWFVAPVLLGEGKPATEGFSVADLGSAPRLEDAWTEKVGEDVLVGGYLTKSQGNSC
jgi:diaminohydroxyphosphoribosylaminopyrimidine deaminase/5-amino-6-(5-phosphoribosylamino)uracil reductase